jgi:hypothetical protein
MGVRKVEFRLSDRPIRTVYVWKVRRIRTLALLFRHSSSQAEYFNGRIILVGEY